MASKSAQYCCTNPGNTVGLMLLSEVALGVLYEVKEGEVILFPSLFNRKNNLFACSVEDL